MPESGVYPVRLADEARAVLLVDDDQLLRGALADSFRRRGWDVGTAASRAEVADAVRALRPDVAIMDLELPDGSGLDVLARLQSDDPDLACIILSAYADVPTAVRALRAGAETVLEKPVDFDHLFTVAERAADVTRLRRRHRLSQAYPGVLDSLDALGRCPRMRAVARELLVLAPGRAPVLLQGETGTGKGHAARLLHALSPRAQGPFVELNCAGLSAALLESELFGHERGAFTDARVSKRGLLEVADGGTLFLDEISELQADVQPKPLKAIEELRFRRVGGLEERRVDVRVVLASNRDLAADVRAGRFRADLYYRLVGSVITIPPLRTRAPSEIVRLATTFLLDEQCHLGRGPVRLTDAALTVLETYPWPGNVRELRSVIATALLRAVHADAIDARHLSVHDVAPANGGRSDAVDDTLSLRELERRHIARVLVRTGGNRMQTARILGVTRTTLYKKIADYDLEGVGRS